MKEAQKLAERLQMDLSVVPTSLLSPSQSLVAQQFLQGLQTSLKNLPANARMPLTTSQMQTAQQLLQNLETNWNNLPGTSKAALSPAELRAVASSCKA